MEQRSILSSTTTLSYPRKLQVQAEPKPPPFTQTFNSPANAGAKKVYFKVMGTGALIIVLIVFAVFSIFWGAVWKTPERKLEGWVVDFDNALIGQAVTQALTTPLPQFAAKSGISWTSVPASQFPGGLSQLADEVMDQKTWVAIAVHTNATARLLQSYASPTSIAYNGSEAITVYAAEARNENAFRLIIYPSIQAQLTAAAEQFSLQAVSRLLSNKTTLSLLKTLSILETSPQTVLAPVGYTVDNLVPFDKPAGSAVTLIGMIYQLIIAFFITMLGYAVRDMSGMNTRLTLRSLITLRFASVFGLYFLISFCYTLLNLAFQLDFTKKFGRAGFLVFWMLNWIGMLSVGLALESLITVLTPKFVTYFLISWIITNVSVSMLPIEVLPIVYRYGYAAPFYNISHASRCILFVPVNFAILMGWVNFSCITLVFLQWFVRRGAVKASKISEVDNNKTGDVVNVVPRADSEEMEESVRRDIELMEERERYINEGRLAPVARVSPMMRSASILG